MNTLAKNRSFPFLSLPLEIRGLVYSEVFKNRAIVLADRLPLPESICGRRYWINCLENPNYTDDGTIPLLLLCKQINKEAQPLLDYYTPSHLIFNKATHKLPNSYDIADDRISFLPLKHITKITLYAPNLGENRKIARKCLNGELQWSFGHDLKYPDLIPPVLKRYPNLEGLGILSDFLDALPSLRQIHIFDILKDGLLGSEPLCECPRSGSKDFPCTCGTCTCMCIQFPPMHSDLASTTFEDIDFELRQRLLKRYRMALPTFRSSRYAITATSDYEAVHNLIMHGVHVFLHDQSLLLPRTEMNCSLNTSSWTSIYHLAPPKSSKVPPHPPREPAESPRQKRVRRSRENLETSNVRAVVRSLTLRNRDRIRRLLNLQQCFISSLAADIEELADIDALNFKNRLDQFEAGLALAITVDLPTE